MFSAGMKQGGWTLARVCLVFCAVVSLGWFSPAEARRVALIIANSTYSHAPLLPNPANDAELVAQAASAAGFEVIAVPDLTKADFDQHLRDFRQKADGADVALVYYAGHGIESGGKNYLLPVDARLSEPRDLSFEAVDLDIVLQNMAGAQRQVIILDACRDNPFGVDWPAARQSRGGLAQNQVPGALIIYAASQGQVAVDGDGTNSPFARAVARWLPEPGLQLQLIGGKIADDVAGATGQRQRPWTYSGMGGEEFFLVPTARLAVSAPAAGQSEGDNYKYDSLTWRSVSGKDTLEEYLFYLREFPNGIFASTARERVAELRAGNRTRPQVAGAPAAAGGVLRTVTGQTAAERPKGPAPSPVPAPVPAAAKPEPARVVMPPLAPGGTDAGLATREANTYADRSPLPAMPATPRFPKDGYPECRENYQRFTDMIGRVNEINNCLRALSAYSVNVMNAFNVRMSDHQREISRLYEQKVARNPDYTEGSQQDFFRRMRKEFADSNPDGIHFAERRAAEERYKTDSTYLQESYCTAAGAPAGCAGGTP
jgi:uncharacterized caspase-like protein